MRGKSKQYTVNVDLFNDKYGEKGGVWEFIRLRLEGRNYKFIAKVFGFTASRAHQVGRALEDNNMIPKKSEIERQLFKDLRNRDLREEV